MAGIFQGDIIIKTMIELGIQDMRANPWLLDHMLFELTANPYYSQKYGTAQVNSCKEWFANNEIDIVMNGRKDRDRYPCVTIEMGPSSEKSDMKSMADLSAEKIVLMPTTVGKTIPYVIPAFTIVGYDIGSGYIQIPSNIDLTKIAIGMTIVDPLSSTGYVINDIDGGGVYINPGTTISVNSFAILPSKPFFEARIEHAFMQESYKIGCHSHGDPQVMLWLHSIVLYSIFRYRESLLEACGFAESIVSSGGVENNGDVEAEWSRYINLSGQVENSWVKSPRRFVEVAILKGKPVTPTPANPTGYVGGIKIISNLDSEEGVIDEANEVWTTIADDET